MGVEEEGVCILELMRADRKGPKKEQVWGSRLRQACADGEGKVWYGLWDFRRGGGPRDLGGTA